MPKVIILFLLIAASALVAPAQSQSQSAIDKLPTVTTQGDTNPEAVSDINAQLIWLLAAAPAPQDSPMETAARSEYWNVAFGRLNAQNLEKLSATLRDFRSRHDAFADDYNTLIPSVSRDDVWMEYRNFRTRVSDLVAETVRTLNDFFPDGATQLHSTIEECKRTMYLSAYRSSLDPNYATNPHTAATGVTYIQGAVNNTPNPSSGKRSTPSAVYVTAVIVGMVPGCPGKVYPQVRIGDAADGWVTGPKTLPLEYVNFQAAKMTTGHQSSFGAVVSCAISNAQ